MCGSATEWPTPKKGRPCFSQTLRVRGASGERLFCAHVWHVQSTLFGAAKTPAIAEALCAPGNPVQGERAVCVSVFGFSRARLVVSAGFPAQAPSAPSNNVLDTCTLYHATLYCECVRCHPGCVDKVCFHVSLVRCMASSQEHNAMPCEQWRSRIFRCCGLVAIRVYPFSKT